MYTNDDKLVYKDQVFQIVGCAIEVLKSHRPNHGSRAWVDVEYLRITKFRVGVILNFRNPKLEWERIIL